MYRVEQIMALLSYFKSAPVKAWSKGERIAKKCQYWFLGGSILFLIILFVLGVINYYNPLSDYLKIIALFVALISQVFSILFLLPDIVIGCMTLIRWRSHMLVSLIEEIDKDEKNSSRLLHFNEDELQYAKYWLEMKIARNESRLKFFFGDKTAALALLGLSWPIVKELGGVAWLSSSFNQFLTSGSVLNTIIWLGLAFLLGISLGGIVMKNINERYKHQVSLIELSLKLKSMCGKV